MTAPAEQADPAVAMLVDNEAAAQDRVADSLVASLMVLWAGFTAFYAGDAVAAFGQRVAQLVVMAQRQAGSITEAHLRQQMARIQYRLPSNPIVDLPTDLRLGASTADVYQRPIREVRYLVSTDIPLAEAVQTATDRLERIARTDLQLARADASQQMYFATNPSLITGWRRIIHPELGAVCGLCIAASDRVYKRIQRMDLHPGCKCTTLPVTEAADPGRQLNADDLARIYEAAGGTTESRALAQTRFEVRQNGELGPVLVTAGENMKGPAQVKRQLSDRAAAMRREQLQRQIAELQSRGRLSQWHQDRLEQLQELLDAA